VRRHQPASACAPTIKRIGFFHFATAGTGDPVESLRESLQKKAEGREEATKNKCFDDCLIVLLEAFNFRGEYSGKVDASLYPSIKNKLADLSSERKVAFVVGLIEESAYNKSGYSSAYLIDGKEVCERLSCKTAEDWPEPSLARYRPRWSPCDKTILHRGVCVAALVCMDGSDSPTKAKNMNGINEERRKGDQIAHRHKALLDQIDEHGGTPAVLCIPARMLSLSSEAVATCWRERAPRIAIVVANATSAYPSVIRFDGYTPTGEDKTERVVIAPWL
jgi:hypothetical protein